MGERAGRGRAGRRKVGTSPRSCPPAAPRWARLCQRALCLVTETRDTGLSGKYQPRPVTTSALHLGVFPTALALEPSHQAKVASHKLCSWVQGEEGANESIWKSPRALQTEQ